jgi:hypothetical protein
MILDPGVAVEERDTAGRVTMAEWLYLKYVLAERERELNDSLARRTVFRRSEPEGDRPVLSAGLEGWSWPRASHVGALVGLAFLATLALPIGILGVAWVLRGILSFLGG